MTPKRDPNRIFDAEGLLEATREPHGPLLDALGKLLDALTALLELKTLRLKPKTPRIKPEQVVRPESTFVSACSHHGFPLAFLLLSSGFPLAFFWLTFGFPLDFHWLSEC